MGGTGKQDAAQLTRYFKKIQGVSEIDIAVVRAFRDGNLDAAEKSVDKLRTIGANSLAAAQDFGGERLRTLFVDYSESIGKVADAYRAFIDAPANTTDARFTRL